MAETEDVLLEETRLYDMAAQVLGAKSIAASDRELDWTVEALRVAFSTKYSAIALDIDNTVTNSLTHEFVPEVLDLVVQLAGKGVYVIFASGRGTTGTQSLFDLL